VRLEGKAFGDVPLNLEYKLEVWDSSNSAGVIIDAVRAAKIVADRSIGGPVTSPAAYFMKSPPVQRSDNEARTRGQVHQRRDRTLSPSPPDPPPADLVGRSGDATRRRAGRRAAAARRVKRCHGLAGQRPQQPRRVDKMGP
jgi:hypothetical protein